MRLIKFYYNRMGKVFYECPPPYTPSYELITSTFPVYDETDLSPPLNLQVSTSVTRWRFFANLKPVGSHIFDEFPSNKEVTVAILEEFNTQSSCPITTDSDESFSRLFFNNQQHACQFIKDFNLFITRRGFDICNSLKLLGLLKRQLDNVA